MEFFDDIQLFAELKLEGNIELREPFTIDELYELMNKNWDLEKFGPYSLSKIPFIKNIRIEGFFLHKFDIYIVNMYKPGGKIKIIDIAPIRWNETSLFGERRKAVNELKKLPAAELKRQWIEYYRGIIAAIRELAGEKAVPSQ